MSNDSSSETDSLDTSNHDEKPIPDPDEEYCQSCGAVIKSQAEVCPECGVGVEKQESNSGYTIPDHKQFEYEKIANKDTTTVMIVSFLLTPIGYYMVGKTGLAIINLLTLNYFFIGPLIVPFHTRKIIKDAKSELRRAGVEGY